MGRDGTIRARFIIEVIGRPQEYLTETLENFAKQIGEEKGITVIEKKVNIPKLMENQKDFYTNFAEIEIETEEMVKILILMFKYMPAHIEIISPENVSLSNFNWNEMLNELTRRLHAYDEIARVIQVEKNILEQKLKEVLSQAETREIPVKENKKEEKVKKIKKSKKK